MSERFLVTGAFGCIGAWTVKHLVDAGVPVWTFDLPGEGHRLRLVMDDAAIAKINPVEGDITDFEAFERVVVENGITHIVHLAALQVPFVRANPVLGAQVNVVGSTIVLETAKRHADQIQGLSYASSVGVYGGPDLYPDGPLAHDATHHPPNLYGVLKHCNEDTARIYWEENQLRSVGLRPYVVYGPGRDQGWTSTPTKAMLAAAVGQSYRISFGGTVVYHHASEVAECFLRAARQRLDGAPVYNVGGISAPMEEVIAAIDTVVPELAGQITFDPPGLPHPPAMDDRELQAALGPIAWMSLENGVRKTVEHFRAAIEAGRMDVERGIQ